MKNYPTHAFGDKRTWLRDVRKRWARFRKWRNNHNGNNIWSGCAYYPKKVHEWLNQFEEMDRLMREYYKNT